ncbi:ATP-binding protein [Streptomyces jumonjinensis]|uniref:ATP-binding protein n=1 Tax=Streptomyces jumonjinensis TaxID=1945 RepID=UPI00188688B3|nr:ATP-binding protein [Streptomyces jumonjinensis]
MTPSTNPAPFRGARLVIEIPSDPAVARKARDWLAAPLRSEHPGLTDDVLLCLSEVVTNAHRHTSTPVITIDALLDETYVDVRVHDDRADALPEPAGLQLADEGGRGLLLLDACADAWGVAFPRGRRPYGKTVWFRLAVRPERAPALNPGRSPREPGEPEEPREPGEPATR